MRTIMDFLNPRLKAGRIPWGRTAIVAQIIGALIFLGYTLAKKDIKVPFSGSSYEVQVIFPDAKGLDPLDGPPAAVAGSPVGKVTEVKFENGRAIATLELDSNVDGKIFADATAALRPASALQNLLVNVDPGSPESGPLPDGQPIQPQNTDAFVSIDELTSIFDADTQAYMQIVISEAQLALHGRDGELRDALAKLGKLTDTATPVSNALAARRQLLTRLVGSLDTIVQELAERGDQLGTAVDAGSRTLAVTAARTRELQTAARDLAPVVTEANRSLRATRGITEPLAPALDRIAPAADSLPPTAEQLRRLVAPAGHFLDQLDTLTTEGQRPLSLLASGTENLGAKALELIPVAKDLTFRTQLMDQYKGGLAQFADTWGGAYSVADAGGIFGQTDVLKFEAARPENFGFPAAASAHAKADQRAQINTLLAKVLERSCVVQNSLACVLRFGIPGLPPQPLTAATGPRTGG